MRKHLFVCEDEILNTTQAKVKGLSCSISFVDKKVTDEKNNCLIDTILLIIICLLLLLTFPFVITIIQNIV